MSAHQASSVLTSIDNTQQDEKTLDTHWQLLLKLILKCASIRCCQQIDEISKPLLRILCIHQSVDVKIEEPQHSLSSPCPPSPGIKYSQSLFARLVSHNITSCMFHFCSSTAVVHLMLNFTANSSWICVDILLCFCTLCSLP